MIEYAKIARRLAFSFWAVSLGALITGCATAPKMGKPGKLYHIGLIWLQAPGDATAQQTLIDAARAFAREIPEVQFLSVGKSAPQGSALVDTSFDLCLVMRFEDQAAMDRYAQHPVHQKAAQEAFLPLAKKIQFYDFIAE